MTQTSIVAEEAERFGRLAADWWDPDGASAMLHRLNPVRLKYGRDQTVQHWQCDECDRRPLAGKTALDVGCGAGLLAEALARLGAAVTGIAASPEVIEHVADPALFMKALSQRLAPGGLLVLSTPNATAWSRLLMITVAEGLGRIPRGTHDFDKFVGPDRMKQLLSDAELVCIDFEGIAWSPARGLHLSDDMRLNYLVAAKHQAG